LQALLHLYDLSLWTNHTLLKQAGWIGRPWAITATRPSGAGVLPMITDGWR